MQNDQRHPPLTPSYRVVKNEEGRAAVWPDILPLPAGWTATDMTGSRDECLAYIQLLGGLSTARCRVDTSVVVA
jgi:uncharacterized protein YbdZ (MbtH family)